MLLLLSPLASIPEHILSQILLYCDVRDLVSVGKTSTYFQKETEHVAGYVLRQLSIHPQSITRCSNGLLKSRLFSLTRKRLFVLGGCKEISPLKTVSSFDVSSGKWSNQSSLVIPRYGFAIAKANCGIFIVSGDTKESTGTVEMYDYISERWSRIKSLPEKLRRVSAAHDTDVLYVTGGFNPETCSYSDTTYMLSTKDINRMSWSRVGGGSSKMVRRRCEHASVFHRGVMWVAGGRVQGVQKVTNSTEIFDPATLQWTSAPDMLSPRTEFHLVVLVNELYAVGGDRDDDNIPVKGTIEKYDDHAGRWRKIADFPRARSQFAVALSGKHIYVIGGRDISRKVYFTSWDAFNIENMSWEASRMDETTAKNMPLNGCFLGGAFEVHADHNVLREGGAPRSLCSL